MDILFLLIPLSAVLVLVIVAVFGWAVHTGQFDDLEREGQRLLRDDPEALDQGQASSAGASRQFDGAPGKGQEA
jgi:cbb3-type cytochrome oxidase maturation protein